MLFRSRVAKQGVTQEAACMNHQPDTRWAIGSLMSRGMAGLLLAVLWLGIAVAQPGNGFVLPDSSNATIAFAPDGARALVHSRRAGQLVLYDLARRREQWRVPGGDLAGISFSPRGEFAVLVTQRHNDVTATLTTVRLADGHSGAARRLPRLPNAEDTAYSSRAARLSVVADDGASLITAFESGVLAFWPGEGDAPVSTARKPGYYREIALNGAASHLAALHHGAEGSALYILEKDSDAWRERAQLPGVSAFRWLDGGSPRIAMLTTRGIELWEGASPKLAVPLAKGAYEVSGGGVPSVFFSADGAYAAVATASSFDVYTLTDGARVFTHAENVRGAHPGLLLAAAFNGAQLRAFLSTGDFVVVDLSARRMVQRVSFGALGSYSRNWYQDGSSWNSRYRPVLAPGARYVGLDEGKAGYRVVELP